MEYRVCALSSVRFRSVYEVPYVVADLIVVHSGRSFCHPQAYLVVDHSS